MNRRGQVTIFIVVAILIVVGIVVAFWLMGRVDVGTPSDLNPKQFIQKCVGDAVEDSIEIILKNGGLISPTQTITYLDEEYNYLCYQADYYLNCIDIHPGLENLIEGEIRESTKTIVQNCFDSLRNDWESKGFDVAGGSTDYQIDLLPGKVDILLKKDIEISRGGSVEMFSDFDTSMNSPLYWLTMIVRDIVNDEATSCNINYNDFVLFNPGYKLSKFNYDYSDIYVVEHRATGAEFKFAMRGCAFAPGL